jgi:hypothetical protein
MGAAVMVGVGLGVTVGVSVGVGVGAVKILLQATLRNTNKTAPIQKDFISFPTG